MTYIFTPILTQEQTNRIITLYSNTDPVSIEQYPGFAEANSDKNILHYIYSSSDGTVSAYAQMDVRQFRIANITFGPIATSPDIYRQALLQIKQYCTRNLIPILKVTPPHFHTATDSDYFHNLQKTLKFQTSDQLINWSTLVLSVQPSEEDIFRKFADNHRQSIKKALKMGLSAILVTDPDIIDVFALQHAEMYKSRGLKIDPEKNKVHFKKLFNFFNKNSVGYFLIVKENENIIGGVCCVIQGNIARYLEGYSLPSYRKYPINHLALFEAIKIAKDKGLSHFDFGGYANNVTETDQLYTINKFKKDFRGELVNYPKTMLISNFWLSSFLYSLYKALRK